VQHKLRRTVQYFISYLHITNLSRALAGECVCTSFVSVRFKIKPLLAKDRNSALTLINLLARFPSWPLSNRISLCRVLTHHSNEKYSTANSCDPAIYGAYSLKEHACWGRGFDSCSERECLSVLLSLIIIIIIITTTTSSSSSSFFFLFSSSSS